MSNKKNKELIALGKHIKTAREKVGLTQEELAFKAGLDRSYVGGIERGERNPSYLTILKILQQLRITLSDLGKSENE